MVMLVVVPVEEVLAKRERTLLVAESTWKVRSILEGLKLAFGEGIIIRDVWAAMRFCDSQVSDIPSENSRTLRVQLFLNKKLLEDGTPLLLGA
jgi:hypothetical protein